MTNLDNGSTLELNLVSDSNPGAPGRALKQGRGWREKKKRRNQKRGKSGTRVHTTPSKRRKLESDSDDDAPPDLLQPNHHVKSPVKDSPTVQRTENKFPPSTLSKKKEVRLSQAKKKDVKPSPSPRKADSTTDLGGKFPQGKGVISSLFRYNPEIPVVAQETVLETKEEVFSVDRFRDINLHPFMIKNLEENLKVTKTTSVQKEAIPVLLQGKDALVKSQTGSGKTLAYSIPVVQRLQAKKQKILRSDGPYAIVLVPTRELAIQTHDVIQKLVKPFCWIVPGCIIGGERRKAEKARLRKGINIIVATPGRLVDHIQNTQSLQLGRVEWLILDEADRLLDMGFEKDIRAILSGLNDKRGSTVRQNVLLSATLSEGVERLAGMSLNNPVKITVSKADIPSEKKQTSSEEDRSAEETFVTPAELKQHFILVPSKLRLVTLAAFILWKCKFVSREKMLVFLATQDSVDFHHLLLNNILNNDDDDDAEFGGSDITFSRLHGNMTQQERTEVFQQFREARSGVLLCTDVAARGLHLPKVSWIVQYNTPGSATDYIHRAGRTGRIGKQGHTLLFLLPSEVEFVKVLATNNISMDEMAMDEVLKTLYIHSRDSGKKKTTKPGAAQQAVQEAATSLQMSFENYVLSDQDKLAMARKAYQSFIRAYATFPSTLKHVFHVKKLHLGHVAKSFGLRDAPGDITNLVAASKSIKKAETQKKASKSQMLKDVRKGKQQKPRLDMMSEFSSGL